MMVIKNLKLYAQIFGFLFILFLTAALVLALIYSAFSAYTTETQKLPELETRIKKLERQVKALTLRAELKNKKFRQAEEPEPESKSGNESPPHKIKKFQRQAQD